MLALIRNTLDAKNKHYWFWGIALLALFVELCTHALLPISISNDSYGYLELSQHLGNPNVAPERSVGYPFLLSVLGTNLLDNFIPIILVQAAMAVAIPLIIFNTLIRFGLGYAVLGASIACIYFYNFVSSLYILTELTYVFSLAIYTFYLVRYFDRSTWRNLLWVIASCWLIALVRVSGSMHFLSLLFGIAIYVLMNCINKKPSNIKLGLQHFFVAITVFLSISVIQHMITHRISSVIWPHFVFNWVYKDSSVSPIYYGIIHLENGPATKKLFQEIEQVITKNPNAFNTLKAGGTEEIKALTPEKNGQYSSNSVKLLMDDLLYNNKHDLRSWWIEGVLSNYGAGSVGTSKLLGDAIIEAFKKHPQIILKRLAVIIYERIGGQLKNGIRGNIVMLPTAYYHQIPTDISTPPTSSLKPGFYKQWTYDLFQHTGNNPANRTIEYFQTYPIDINGAIENVKSDNLIGFGHYLTILGMQVLRVCWILIAGGILIFPFLKQAPLLGSLLCASILPPIASVFISETDPRHLLMSSPIHIVTAGFVFYSFIILYKKISEKFIAGVYVQ